MLEKQLRGGVSVSILYLVIMEWGKVTLEVVPCFVLADVWIVPKREIVVQFSGPAPLVYMPPYL